MEKMQNVVVYLFFGGLCITQHGALFHFCAKKKARALI